MEAFVISLESDVERRREITRQFEKVGIPFKIFSAVNGKALTEDELKKFYDRERATAESHDLTRGEIGCALSHLGVYREIVRKNIPYALVVEDDAKLSEDLCGVISALQDYCSAEEPMVVLLHYVEKYMSWSAKRLGENHLLVKTYGGIPNAHGYFLTMGAARNLAEKLFPLWAVADRWDKFSHAGIIKVRAVVPYCIDLSEHALQSNLDADRVKRMTLYRRGGIAYSIHRYLYQKFLRQILVRPFLRVKTQKRIW